MGRHEIIGCIFSSTITPLMKKTIPSVVLLLWFIGFPLLWLIVSILAGVGHSGGEQVELTTAANGIGLYFAGSIFVIVLICSFQLSWCKKNLLWLVPLFLIFTYLTYKYYCTE